MRKLVYSKQNTQGEITVSLKSGDHTIPVAFGFADKSRSEDSLSGGLILEELENWDTLDLDEKKKTLLRLKIAKGLAKRLGTEPIARIIQSRKIKSPKKVIFPEVSGNVSPREAINSYYRQRDKIKSSKDRWA